MTLHSTAQANPVYVLTPEDLAILSSALEEAMSSPDKDSQSTETLNLFRDLATQLSDAKRENITAAQLEEILGTSIATDPKLCEIVMRAREAERAREWEDETKAFLDKVKALAASAHGTSVVQPKTTSSIDESPRKSTSS